MKDIKLKYYLRGLGIGILVTALILGIAGKEEAPMTDAQIRERAVELGMMDADSQVLSELRENEPQTEAVNEQEPENVEELPGVREEESGDANETEEVESQEMDKTENSKPQETDEVSITIESGAHSYDVSELLYESKLVDNAEYYDQYLCDIGYSRSIKAGAYEIPVGATWEEIAKIITGKH